MSTNDGQRLVASANTFRLVKCTRWTELCESMRFHASLAQAIQVYLNSCLLSAKLT